MRREDEDEDEDLGRTWEPESYGTRTDDTEIENMMERLRQIEASIMDQPL